MLKLFARLKELSAKLLPGAAKKPRDRLLTGSSKPAQPSTSVKTSEEEIPVQARFIDTGNLDSPSAPGKIVPKEAVTPSRVASPLRRIGAIVTSPFRGPKPIYKNKLFWAGSGLGLGALALGGAWLFVDNSVSHYKAADALNYVRPGSITIKGLNGAVLLQTGEATRETLKLWQMPANLKNAFVAIEDRRFYEHDGVDYKGVTRAMVTNLTSKNISEGASSIDQQLARVVYLDQERSFWRKLREIRLAQKLGKQLTKDQILERYLNLVYLGEHTYGVADAAMVYFSKTVDKLSLAEMATLAAMPPAPNKYSPFVNPDFAGKRRNLVLDRMVDAKFISKAEAETAKAEVLTPKRSQLPSAEQQARYFTKYIEQELPERITKEQIKAGGLIVETTLNPEWQKKAEEVVNTTVRQNRGSFGQAAMVSVDPRTGGIRSMVGGTDFAKNQFNRVTQAKRQPGSTFKPIVYTTAVAGGISPNKSYLDAPFEIGLDEGGNYKPKNAGKNFKGQISMRDALVNSVNIVAIKVLIDTGWQPVIDLAQKMGIKSELKPVYALALGALEVNLLEMTGAYSTFANKGIHNPVHGIIRVTNNKGEILYENQAKPEQVIEPGTSAIMTSMMRGVVNEGTAKSAQIGRPVAGKTGTTDKERDLWFIGFVPQLVTGVWLGNDNNQPTGNASSTAAYAWSRFMKTAVQDIPVQDFLSRSDNGEKRKPELKLDPVRPRYQRTLAASAKDDKNGDESQDGSRRSRRSRRSESADNNTSETPRRSRRSRRSEGVENSSSPESTPRRSRRRSRRSEGSPSSSEE